MRTQHARIGKTAKDYVRGPAGVISSGAYYCGFALGWTVRAMVSFPHYIGFGGTEWSRI